MESETQPDFQDILKHCQQIRAEGMFRCKNDQGEIVLLLYNLEAGICMTMAIEEE